MSYLVKIMPYATLLTVLVGIVFGILTNLQNQRTRYLNAAAHLVSSVQTISFKRGVQRIVELPVNADPSLVLGDKHVMRAVYDVSYVFESLGVLVFHRLLPIEIVDHLTGGYVRATWLRLKPAIMERQAVLGPMFGEWYQWLAERMLEREAPDTQVGAAEAFRDWRSSYTRFFAR